MAARDLFLCGTNFVSPGPPPLLLFLFVAHCVLCESPGLSLYLPHRTKPVTDQQPSLPLSSSRSLLVLRTGIHLCLRRTHNDTGMMTKAAAVSVVLEDPIHYNFYDPHFASRETSPPCGSRGPARYYSVGQIVSWRLLSDLHNRSCR